MSTSTVFQRRASSTLLWLGVAYVFTDVFASIRFIDSTEVQQSSGHERGSSGSGSPDLRRGTGAGGGSDAEPGSRDAGVVAVLVDKLSMRFFKYQRGDLVVIKSPEQPRQRLVRRLVGSDGDFVSVAGGKMERLPKGSCWVEADAGLRGVGGDSRTAWGAVPLALVEGRVSHVLWPPARWCALAPGPCPSGTRVVGRGGSLEFLTPPDADDWWS